MDRGFFPQELESFSESMKEFAKRKRNPRTPEEKESLRLYLGLGEYFKSNCFVEKDDEVNSVLGKRYTDGDGYKPPGKVKPHLLYHLPDSKFPEELTSTMTSSKSKEVKANGSGLEPDGENRTHSQAVKRKLEDLKLVEMTIKTEKLDVDDDEDRMEAEEKENENIDYFDDNDQSDSDEGAVTDYQFFNGEDDDEDDDDIDKKNEEAIF